MLSHRSHGYDFHMLIPPALLSKHYDLRGRKVLHVGAHTAEEAPLYLAAEWGPTIWVEAQPNLVRDLVERFADSPDVVLEGCVWGESGKNMILHQTNNIQSSSLYPLGTHRDHYPEVRNQEELHLQTVRLDELLGPSATFDFINLDLQGAELEALVGLGQLMQQVRAVYCEVNREELYVGIPLVGEIDTFLGDLGFMRVATVWTPAGWGDALYLRASASDWGPAKRRAREMGLKIDLWSLHRRRVLKKRTRKILAFLVALKQKIVT